MRRIARVCGREQASRARVTGESMDEDDIAKSRAIRSYRDAPMKRGRGLQARGAYKEVPRLS